MKQMLHKLDSTEPATFFVGEYFCDFYSKNLNRFLNHTWVKHSRNLGSSQRCNNLQSFRRNIKNVCRWFYDIYFENGLCADGNLNLENPHSSRGSSDFHEGPGLMKNLGQDTLKSNEEVWVSSSNQDYDHDNVIVNFLFELRETFNCTIAANCFVSEKVAHILKLEHKIRK